MLEHNSEISVPTYKSLFPITLGIIARPGNVSPILRFVCPSPSSKTKQFLAKGNIEPSGNMSDSTEVYSA